MPKPGYLKAIKEMCEKTGTLFIADEVQTGLMRSGEMWCIETYGVVPDMLVTGKGISGGIYPIAAVVANERSAAWLKEDGWGHMSTFGGAELGCIAAPQGAGDLRAAGDALAVPLHRALSRARA